MGGNAENTLIIAATSRKNSVAQPASERKGRESGSGSQPPRFAGLAVWCIWIACNRSSERITGDFHEKAGPCQAFFLVVPFVQPTADQREALLAFSLSFIERFLFGHRDSRSPTSGRRTMLPSRILKSPTRPTSIRTLCGAIAPVPAGCPQLETGAAVS